MVDDVSNAPEYTVAELSGAVKRSIEDSFGHVRVRGEVSGFRGASASGHVYFSLKDASARIDAVIWKGVFGRMRVRPEEGLDVIATGKLTTFAGKSSYQLIIEHIEPAGIGALMALLEERRRRLAKEGLFDDARKQLLPYLPRVIGVVTSPTGAVIRDILHRLADRFPVHVVVWPVRVQGETSAAEVSAAIAGFNALPNDGPIARPDVIIVARGGGSLEDLWSFNEENVVRAAANSLIPLISAIGHETDWTLLDHAADLRAPTPTGAAELCVPVRAELMADVNDLSRRHEGAMRRLLDHKRSQWRSACRALPGGDDLIAQARQAFDRASERSQSSMTRQLQSLQIRLERLARRLQAQSPHAHLARMAQGLQKCDQRLRHVMALVMERRTTHFAQTGRRLRIALGARANSARQQWRAHSQRCHDVGARMDRAWHHRHMQHHERLSALGQMLSALSYRNVLSRGYAIVRDMAGEPLRLREGIGAGVNLKLEFIDGQIGVTTNGGVPAPSDSLQDQKPKTLKPTRAQPARSQGSLF
jgi:exodeoxyribonuclease VII large subunit